MNFTRKQRAAMALKSRGEYDYTQKPRQLHPATLSYSMYAYKLEGQKAPSESEKRAMVDELVVDGKLRTITPTYFGPQGKKAFRPGMTSPIEVRHPEGKPLSQRSFKESLKRFVIKEPGEAKFPSPENPSVSRLKQGLKGFFVGSPEEPVDRIEILKGMADRRRLDYYTSPEFEKALFVMETRPGVDPKQIEALWAKREEALAAPQPFSWLGRPKISKDDLKKIVSDKKGILTASASDDDELPSIEVIGEDETGTKVRLRNFKGVTADTLKNWHTGDAGFMYYADPKLGIHARLDFAKNVQRLRPKDKD